MYLADYVLEAKGSSMVFVLVIYLYSVSRYPPTAYDAPPLVCTQSYPYKAKHYQSTIGTETTRLATLYPILSLDTSTPIAASLFTTTTLFGVRGPCRKPAEIRSCTRLPRALKNLKHLSENDYVFISV